MNTPERIQLKRTKGWRMPPNTVKVDRTTKFGNPFKVGDHGDAKCCVELFEVFCTNRDQKHFDPIRGKNLACWCKPGEPCHADVLLEIANR